MAERRGFDKIELHLVKVLHTVITERSVSRAAMRLHSTQPDGQRAVEAPARADGRPVAGALGPGPGAHRGRAAAARAGGRPAARGRDAVRAAPAQRRLRRRAAASHASASRPATTSTRCSCPSWWRCSSARRRSAHSSCCRCRATIDYRRNLARARSTWSSATGSSRPASCTWAGCSATRSSAWWPRTTRPRAGARGWTEERYLPRACRADAAARRRAGRHRRAPGRLGLERHIVVRSPHFSLIPLMVARSLLVLTTGRLFCTRYVDALPVRIVRCPMQFPPLTYYQLWHERTPCRAAVRWLREQVRDVARQLAVPEIDERAGDRALPRSTGARAEAAMTSHRIARRPARLHGRRRRVPTATARRCAFGPTTGC